MGVIQRVVKPRNHRTKRILQNRGPKIIENTKQTLFIRGRKTNDDVLKCFKELYFLKKPHATILNDKHDILPFEDAVPVESMCQKFDSSLFVFASHNKKRPNNLILGCTYNYHILDMFEMGINNYKGISDFQALTPSLGVKPGLIFIGEEFETVHTLKRLKSMFVDLFQQRASNLVHLPSMEYVFTFTYAENKILLRTYRVKLTNVGEQSPRVDLEPMGPNADLVLRRQILASDDLYKKASTKPKTQGKKIKNIRRDAFGSKLGRVHMTSQDMGKLQTRKMKGLKKTPLKPKENQKKGKKRNKNKNGK